MFRHSNSVQAIRNEIAEVTIEYERTRRALVKAVEEFTGAEKWLEDQLLLITTEADGLAIEFKELYRRATEAYADDLRGLAKQLSTEGHEKQKECEDLNQRANEVRGKLAANREELKGYRYPHNDLLDKLNRLKASLRVAERDAEAEEAARVKPVSLQGFEVRGPNSAEALREFVASFPPALLRSVSQITYRDIQAVGRTGSPIIGRTSRARGQHQFQIELFYHHPPAAQGIRQTIAHELGHVAYAMFTDQERQRWLQLYYNTNDSQFFTPYAMSDAEEDFGECVAWFKTNAPAFAKSHPEKYAFMQLIFRRLS